MKNIAFTFLIFLTLAQYTFGQNKEIEIVQKNINGEIVLSVKNNSSERKEVTLNVNGNGYEKVNMPITKMVNKNETTEFVTLKPSSKKGINFSSNYTYVSKPTEQETKINSKKSETLNSFSKIDLSKGVVVFTKTGCSRCNKTVNYLIENNIKYTGLNITENQDINNLMWQKLSENKVSNEITMPVIIVNGKLTHSHKDLDTFLKKIK
jgi:glutaredoxin